MNVDSSHLDHVTKLVHLVHALAAQEPGESFFLHILGFEVKLDCHVYCAVAPKPPCNIDHFIYICFYYITCVGVMSATL